MVKLICSPMMSHNSQEGRDIDIRVYQSVLLHKFLKYLAQFGPGSSVGMTPGYGLDFPGSNPGGDEFSRMSSLLLKATRPPVKSLPFLSLGKVRLGRAADHSPTSSATVMEQQSYSSTHSLGHTEPVMRSFYLWSNN